MSRQLYLRMSMQMLLCPDSVYVSPCFKSYFAHWVLWIQCCTLLSQKGQGAPGREPLFSEEEKKQMMLHAYHRQEDLKVSTCMNYIIILTTHKSFI